MSRYLSSPIFLITLLLMLASLLTSEAFSSSLSHRSIQMTNNSPKSNVQTIKASVFRTIRVLPALGLLPLAARAGLFQSDEQDRVDELCSLQKPVNDLLDQLKPRMIPNAVGVYAMTTELKGGKEDSNAVRVYMEVYIKPIQKKMEDLAQKIKLDDSTAQERLKVLPALMKGHILELTQAIESMSGPDQLKESEEVQETLAEFLKLISSKYTVKPLLPSRPLTDAELFGPLSCEFWGKTREPGSNACVSPPESAKSN